MAVYEPAFLMCLVDNRVPCATLVLRALARSERLVLRRTGICTKHIFMLKKLLIGTYYTFALAEISNSVEFGFFTADLCTESRQKHKHRCLQLIQGMCVYKFPYIRY